MKHLYTNQIPEKDFFKVCRLLSRDGVDYFGSNVDPIDSAMVDHIDPPIRLLSHLLSQTECKIISFFCGYYYSKDELKNIWNNIKREEKAIRNDGLLLKRYNGKIENFQDPTYRVYWPSFEGMFADIQEKGNKGWLVLKFPPSIREQYDFVIQNQSSFGLYTKISSQFVENEATITFVVDCRENHLAEAEWRRITEILANLFLLKAKTV